MDAAAIRLTVPGRPPTHEQVAGWIGRRNMALWKRVEQWIAHNYPGVFAPDWIYGGKKHGWSLRYKKNKSFCTLVPEKKRFSVLIVFGAEDRCRLETIRETITARTREAYDKATTYHDGKWLLLTVDGDETLADIERLLAVKRKKLA